MAIPFPPPIYIAKMPLAGFTTLRAEFPELIPAARQPSAIANSTLGNIRL